MKQKENTNSSSSSSSSSLQKIQKKWLDAAIQMGGLGSTIVLSKASAKPIVHNMMKDSFRPMNITSIYKELKAVVPSPILKSCLDEMSCVPTITHHDKGKIQESSDTETDISDDDDDDDDDKDNKIKTSSTTSRPKQQQQQPVEYKNSIYLKNGKNLQTTLYYYNQNQLQNEGNQLPLDQYSSLQSNIQTSKHQIDNLKCQHRNVSNLTNQVLSEPKNHELNSIIQQSINLDRELKRQVDSKRKYIQNVTIVKEMKRKINILTNECRLRKRLCIDFLNMMEESSDGMITVKKCLAGKGPIYLENDDNKSSSVY